MRDESKPVLLGWPVEQIEWLRRARQRADVSERKAQIDAQVDL